MIKFFRKIRQNLLSERKIGKYLKYAIGEIVLVVVGILIALSINNWNEKRQVQNKVNLQLLNIKTAIQSDIETLDRVLMTESFRFHAIKYLLEMSGVTIKLYDYNYNEFPTHWDQFWNKPIPEHLDRDFIEVCFSAIDIGTTASFINYKAIQEFGNSGLFSELKNNELKKIINEYYRVAEMWYSGTSWDYNFELTLKTKDLLENQYLIDMRRMENVEDPIRLIRENKPIIIKFHTLVDKISLTCKQLLDSRKRAEQVIFAIDQELEN